MMQRNKLTPDLQREIAAVMRSTGCSYQQACQDVLYDQPSKPCNRRHVDANTWSRVQFKVGPL
jgi:hypothetical protein